MFEYTSVILILNNCQQLKIYLHMTNLCLIQYIGEIVIRTRERHTSQVLGVKNCHKTLNGDVGMTPL